jgi:hypothetical protein
MLRTYKDVQMGAVRKINAKKQIRDQRMKRFHLRIEMPPLTSDAGACEVFVHRMYLRARREQVAQVFDAYKGLDYTVKIATLPDYEPAIHQTKHLIIKALADAMEIAQDHLRVVVEATLPSGYCAVAMAQVVEVDRHAKQN